MAQTSIFQEKREERKRNWTFGFTCCIIWSIIPNHTKGKKGKKWRI
jgi:hypothetical protein